MIADRSFIITIYKHYKTIIIKTDIQDIKLYTVSLFYFFISKITRLVLNTRIQDSSYYILKELIQQAKQLNNIDLDVAIQIISISEKVKDGDFIKDDLQFKDIVRILAILTKQPLKQIIDGILSYYKTSIPQKYDQLNNMATYIDFQPSPEDSPEEQEPLTSPTSTKKPHVSKPKLNPQAIIEYYTKEKQYCQPAFSIPLLPQVTYQPPEIFEDLQQKIIFNYKTIYLPEIKLLSVPNPTDIKISNQTYHVNPFYQNEAFDVPDVQCLQRCENGTGYKGIQQIIQDIPQSADFPHNVKIITFKPVPQNHSLLDFTGIYGSPNEIKQQVIKDILRDFKCTIDDIQQIDTNQEQNNQLQQEITIFQAFEKYLYHLFYFKGLNIVIDNRYSGNISRCLKFGLEMHKETTAYLFATYINGTLRIQANAAEDLAKDTEITLGIENCVFKYGSKLFEYLILMCRYYYQMNQQIQNKPWKAAIFGNNTQNDGKVAVMGGSLPKKVQNENDAQKIFDDKIEEIYLLQLHQLLGSQLMKKITIQQLIQLIQTDFISSEKDINKHQINDSILSIPYSPYYKAEIATTQMLYKIVENESQSIKIVNSLFDQLTDNTYNKDTLGYQIYQILQNNYQYPNQLSVQQYYKIINDLWLSKKYNDKQGISILKRAENAFYTQSNQSQKILQDYYQLIDMKDKMEEKCSKFQEKQCQQFGDFLVQCVKYNPYYTQQFSKAKKYDTQTVQLQMAHVGYMEKENYNNTNYNIPDYYQQINDNADIKWILQRIFKGATQTDLQEQEQKKKDIQYNECAIFQLANIQQDQKLYQDLVDKAVQKYQKQLQQ